MTGSLPGRSFGPPVDFDGRWFGGQPDPNGRLEGLAIRITGTTVASQTAGRPDLNEIRVNTTYD